MSFNVSQTHIILHYFHPVHQNSLHILAMPIQITLNANLFSYFIFVFGLIIHHELRNVIKYENVVI